MDINIFANNNLCLMVRKNFHSVSEGFLLKSLSLIWNAYWTDNQFSYIAVEGDYCTQTYLSTCYIFSGEATGLLAHIHLWAL